MLKAKIAIIKDVYAWNVCKNPTRVSGLTL